jgi:hypothetical protein
MGTNAGKLPFLAVLPLLGLLACSGKEKPAATPAAQAAPAPAPKAPTTVNLTEENRSHITGTVVLKSVGDSTTITLTLHGGARDHTYPSHVHFGTCAKPGAVVAPLTSVKVGADRSGTSTTTVATSVLTAALQQHGSLLAQSHLSNGKPAACGEIPSGAL